jgi:hypothetical protein
LTVLWPGSLSRDALRSLLLWVYQTDSIARLNLISKLRSAPNPDPSVESLIEEPGATANASGDAVESLVRATASVLGVASVALPWNAARRLPEASPALIEKGVLFVSAVLLLAGLYFLAMPTTKQDYVAAWRKLKEEEQRRQ